MDCWILALAQPSPDCYSHVGNEPAEKDRSLLSVSYSLPLSFYCSVFQINKYTLRKMNAWACFLTPLLPVWLCNLSPVRGSHCYHLYVMAQLTELSVDSKIFPNVQNCELTYPFYFVRLPDIRYFCVSDTKVMSTGIISTRWWATLRQQEAILVCSNFSSLYPFRLYHRHRIVKDTLLSMVNKSNVFCMALK